MSRLCKLSQDILTVCLVQVSVVLVQACDLEQLKASQNILFFHLELCFDFIHFFVIEAADFK